MEKKNNTDVAVSINIEVNVCDSIMVTGKSNAKIKGKPLFKFKSGQEHNYKLEKLVNIDRKFDLLKDTYDEYVKDIESGEIIHECHDNYNHVGHGSDKPKKV